MKGPGMLKIQDIFVSYGRRTVLKGVSLRVESGEVLALIGPNGSGKSTLIRAVSGGLPIHSGRVEVELRVLAFKRPWGWRHVVLTSASFSSCRPNPPLPRQSLRPRPWSA